MGPPMVIDENGSLAGYVYVDLKDRDPGSYVAAAKKAIEKEMKIPAGYFLSWTGQYEYMKRMQARMKIVIPLTLLLIFGILYLGNRSLSRTIIIMTSVPLSLVGSIFLMWALGYNTSVAVWAGAIALIGVAVETTSIMIVYLDQAWRERKKQGTLKNERDFYEATLAGASSCLRPVLMAVSMNIFGLVPVMMATGLGSDVIKRITSPMFGGLFSLAILTLIIVPIIYKMREGRVILRDGGTNG